MSNEQDLERMRYKLYELKIRLALGAIESGARALKELFLVESADNEAVASDDV